MELLRRHPGRTAAVVAGIVLAVACTDRNNPVTPGGGGGTGGGTQPGKPIGVALVACTANVKQRTVSCDEPPPSGDKVPRYLIVGGQHVYVDVTSSNVNYDAGTQAFTFDVTIRNRIPQALGTTDGVAVDPAGVRIFFHQLPAVTSGTGGITVVGDGTATFTSANQPYYQYNTKLDQFQLSAPKTWQLTIPSTVTTFNFVLLVAAAVKYPDGWIEVSGNPNVRSGKERTLTAIVRTPVGNIDSLATNYNWEATPADQLLANYTSPDGTDQVVVHCYRYGAPVMTVTADRVNSVGVTVSVGGSLTMNVQPVGRVWTGRTNTDWQTGSNWMPDSIVPVAQDSAIVPDTVTTGNFPTLSANASIGGVDVLDLTPGGTVPVVNLGAFNLDASGDVLTTNSAAITNTSGVLSLTGIARTVAGTLPFVRVTGTYSLDGNITTRAPLRVDLGRLTNTGFRVQTTSY